MKSLFCETSVVNSSSNKFYVIVYMEVSIQAGDNVRHRTQKSINGGLVMDVDEVNETHALCNHFTGEESVYTQTWFPKEDLELVNL